MKRISLVLAAAFFIAPLCVAQNYPSGDLANFRQEGIASWYGVEFNGRPTASGEIFNSSLYTAAHPTLPFGTLLTVTNLNNGRKVNVKVNDRGPFISSRIIDVSLAAAQMLDMVAEGTAPVLVETLNSYGQTGDSPYWPEANSYAQSEGGNSSANSQLTAPYPVYQTEPVIIQLQPFSQEPVSAQPQQQANPYLQQPVQTEQPRQQIQQTAPSQQIQPVQQALPVQQQLQPVTQPIRPQVQPVPQSQATQPLQIQIPIEIKPIIGAEPVQPVQAPSQTTPPNPVRTTAIQAPAQAPGVSVILAPETPPAAAASPIQVTIKPNKIYRVQIGSFREARNALASFERIKETGLSPVYERNGDYFRVVITGVPSAEMAAVLQKLQTAGFYDPLLREE
jgi:rare lipoprotein A